MRQLTATVAMIAIIAASMPPAVVRAEDSDQGLRDAIAANATERASADTTDTAIPDESAFLDDAALDELVAPVALYPDALLAQVLVAATYPLQIVEADRLLKKSHDLSDAELGEKLKQADWDPSVMVLASGFPTVVTRMSDELEWTEKLGNAMVQQDDDVLAAVQRKRVEAVDTGYLADNAAQVVEEDDTGKIAITPADPKVVYVPAYDPEVVYTSRPTAQPYIAPVQQLNSNPIANPLVAGALAFGAGLLVSNLFGDDDDHNNNNKNNGWNGYWNNDRPINWRDQQFYPRPRWDDGPDQYHAWSWERDRYWNPSARRWQRNTPYAQRQYAADRRDTVGWVVLDNPNGGAPLVRSFRPGQQWSKADAQAQRQAVQAAAERRQARNQADRRFAQQRAAEDRRANQLAAARRDARVTAEAAARQQQVATASKNAAATKAAADAKAQAAAAERKRQQAETVARQKAAADRRAAQQVKASANSRDQSAAKRQAAAKAKAAAANRNPAPTNQAKPVTATDAQVKQQADAKARAAADARRRRRQRSRQGEGCGRREGRAEPEGHRRGAGQGAGRRESQAAGGGGEGQGPGRGRRAGQGQGAGGRQGARAGAG